jgi:hypothetical protein
MFLIGFVNYSGGLDSNGIPRVLLLLRLLMLCFWGLEIPCIWISFF